MPNLYRGKEVQSLFDQMNNYKPLIKRAKRISHMQPAGDVRAGRALGLPLHVGAQQGDAQQEVHHDGAHHHGQPQQDGTVLSSLQGCHCFPFVQ